MPASKSPDQGLAAVLQVLRDAADAISGEYLATQLGRAGRRCGSGSTASRPRGMSSKADPCAGLSPPGRSRQAPGGRSAPGAQDPPLYGAVHHFETLDSTNDLAKKLAAEAPRKAPWWWRKPRLAAGVAWTGSGIRRRGSASMSPAPRPMLPPMELPQITLTTAVAVVRAVRRGWRGWPRGSNGPIDPPQ